MSKSPSAVTGVGCDLVWNDLKVNYGPKMAVKGVDGFVQQGKMLAVMGATGAGKTSLWNALEDLVPIADGRILYDGKELKQLEAEGTFSFS